MVWVDHGPVGSSGWDRQPGPAWLQVLMGRAEPRDKGAPPPPEVEDLF